jgi:hypothetical protein
MRILLVSGLRCLAGCLCILLRLQSRHLLAQLQTMQAPGRGTNQIRAKQAPGSAGQGMQRQQGAAVEKRAENSVGLEDNATWWRSSSCCLWSIACSSCCDTTGSRPPNDEAGNVPLDAAPSVLGICSGKLWRLP